LLGYLQVGAATQVLNMSRHRPTRPALSGPASQYIGTVLWTALGLALAVATLYGWRWPLWTIAPIVLLFGLGAFFLWPTTPPPPPARRGTAFVRGDASWSIFDDVDVQGADAVIDGDAKGAIFRNVRYRASQARRWFR